MKTDLKNQKTELKTELKNQKTELNTKINGNELLGRMHNRNRNEPGTCPHLDTAQTSRSQEELRKKQAEFCTEYNLDLADDTTANMAIVFVDADLGRTPAFREALAAQAKFRVTDTCTQPMFQGRNVALQRVGGKWALVVQFAKESTYLQHEINDKCERRKYMPRTEIGVQVYADKDRCCEDTKDFLECVRSGCRPVEQDHHWVKQPLAFKMTVTGNVFEVKLHDYLLEGTKFTSPTKTNVLKIGQDVNNGDVTNAMGGTTSLLEVGQGSSGSSDPTKADFDAFQAHVKGVCDGLPAASLFAKVEWKAGNFHYNCVETDALCQCISTTGLSAKTVMFEGQKHTLKLIGNGETLGYLVTDRKTGKRRRRMLQRGSVRGC